MGRGYSKIRKVIIKAKNNFKYGKDVTAGSEREQSFAHAT